MTTITIPLTQGKSTTIDEEDYDLAQLPWHVLKASPNSPPYAGRYFNRKHIRMHRLILSRKLGRELLANELVDHKDGNSLNNCRDNLRVANKSQNAQNQSHATKGSVGLRGVYFKNDSPRKKPYYAQIKTHDSWKGLGYFATAEEAHEAYRQASIEHFGEFSPYYDERHP